LIPLERFKTAFAWKGRLTILRELPRTLRHQAPIDSKIPCRPRNAHVLFVNVL